MPRTYPPRRQHVTLRLSPVGLAEVERLAALECPGGGRSEMLRRLIGEALSARERRQRAARA